jgi:hypothetical protein
MMDLPHCPRHIKDRRRWITLCAKRAVPAAMHMVITNVVFTSKRALEIPRTLVQSSAFGAATLSVMHTGSHFTLAFNYGTKISTNPETCTNQSHLFLLLTG